MERIDFEKLINFAIKNEISAQEFYRRVSEKVTVPFLKKLFAQFVEEERNHQQILEGFRNLGPSEFRFTETPDYHLSEEEKSPAVSSDMKPVEAFGLAMKKEEAAVRLYLSFANVTNDPEKKRIFQELAKMEREHKHKMEKAFIDVGYPEVW
ncbi:MAG: ferritin-like domain-containing protein [Thermodesulfobacteriota bacterium]